jgi:hypothetical protein
VNGVKAPSRELRDNIVWEVGMRLSVQGIYCVLMTKLDECKPGEIEPGQGSHEDCGYFEDCCDDLDEPA